MRSRRTPGYHVFTNFFVGMSGEMVSILMVVYKNQHCTVCNPAGLTTCAQKKKHYTLGKIHDHGIHAQHLLIIYVNCRCK